MLFDSIHLCKVSPYILKAFYQPENELDNYSKIEIRGEFLSLHDLHIWPIFIHFTYENVTNIYHLISPMIMWPIFMLFYLVVDKVSPAPASSPVSWSTFQATCHESIILYHHLSSFTKCIFINVFCTLSSLFSVSSNFDSNSKAAFSMLGGKLGLALWN